MKLVSDASPYEEEQPPDPDRVSSRRNRRRRVDRRGRPSLSIQRDTGCGESLFDYEVDELPSTSAAWEKKKNMEKKKSSKNKVLVHRAW